VLFARIDRQVRMFPRLPRQIYMIALPPRSPRRPIVRRLIIASVVLVGAVLAASSLI
jgi:hypothetical protein